MVTDLQPTKARVVADLRASFGEVKCIGSERLVRLGISMTQLHVLNLLDRHGEMAMSRLADMLDVSMSAATGLVDRIEEHGYVERIRVPERPTDRPRPDHGRRTSVARRHRLGADRDPRSDPDGLDETQLTRLAAAMVDLRTAVDAIVTDHASGGYHTHQPQGRS